MHQEAQQKFNDLEDSINKNKEFKRGSSEYDKMVTRIDKLESDVELYKKILAKSERDSKKIILDKEQKEKELKDETDRLTSEVKILKEDKEHLIEKYENELSKEKEEREIIKN